jgi:hypothetical protein
MAIIQRIAENENVFGHLFPDQQSKLLQPLTHLRENFDKDELKDALKDHITNRPLTVEAVVRPILSKVGG